MRFAASRGKPAPIYARGNIKWRQWGSHSKAICNQRFKNRIELRTQTQPLVAKHIGGTIRAQNDPSRTRRTDEVPFIVGCSHFTRKNTRFGAPASSPKHSPCNIHAAITMRFAASRGKPAPIYTRGNIKWRQWSSHSNAICNQRFKNRIELRTHTQPLVAKHIGGTIRAQNDPSRTRRTDEVPFIVGCSHFTRKNTRFGAPASSPKHSPCNIHAAITMRFAASRGKPAPIYARGNIKWRQWSSHSNAICNQRFKNRIELRTQTQPLVAKHIGGTIRAQNDPSRTRRTDEVPFIVGCSHFTRKNTKFGAPASSTKHSPCNIHAAITLRFAASRGKPAPIYARGNIKWRQWGSHSKAICNQRFKNRIELRTQTQPLVAKHIGGTIRAQNDPSRTRRTDEVPFIVGCSHFTRKNTRFHAPASSPKHSPCNIHAAITMRFAASRGKPAPIYARGNIKWRQWGSHSNAICNQRFKNRIELRAQTRPLVAKHIGGTIRAQNDPSRTRRTDEVPFIVGCSHFTRKNTKFGAPASSPKHSTCNIHAAITMRFAASRGKPAPIYARGNIKWRQWSSHSKAICNQRFKNRIELRTQTQPLVAKHIGGTIRAQNDPSRTRRTDEVPFIVGCSHFTRKNTGLVLRLPPQNIAHATFMQPFQCDLAPQRQETHRTTHTGTSIVAKHIEGTKRPQPQPPHRRGSFHRRLQPFYTEKHKVSCSASSPTHHFPSSPLPIVTLPIVTTSLRPLPFLTTSLPHHFPSSPPPFLTIPLHHHLPSSPLPFVTTSLRLHFPSSPLPFVTTSLLHHFPSSPLPFVTTSLRHHFPSSSLPFFTTSLRHHFPSSPLPFLTTSLPHHSPSSYCPFFTTSLPHHFLPHHFPRHHSPSSYCPFFTTSLPHHFPSSPPSLRHHFPSSPLPFVTTLCHSFLFFCCVLLDNVLFCDLPPFIIVNCIK